MRDFSIIVCLLLMFSETIFGQRDKWSWSSNNNNNNRNSIDDRREREFDRRKYESLEDFRGDRYEVNEASTRKPNSQGDEFFNNGGYGINQGSPLGAAGNGYNSNGFGAFPPQGLGGYPPYGNGGQYNNPGFGNFRPGLSPNYPNGGQFNQNFGNAPYYPGAGGYPPNRFNGYNPLGNNAANGVLVGPGGPTGLYGRPPNQFGPFNQFGGAQNQFGGAQNQFGAPNQFGYPNQFGGPYNNNPAGYYSGYGPSNFGPGVPPVGPGFAGYGPFNSKGASGILADESGDDDRKDLNKENKSNQ